MKNWGLILLCFMVFLFVPSVSLASLSPEKMGLLSDSAVVFGSDQPATDRWQASLLKAIYGARIQIADGTADQEQIRTANASVNATGGGSILLRGTFNLAASGTGNAIDMSTNMTYRGLGTALTVLNLGNSVNENVMGASSSSNITIEYLTINGNKANNTETGPAADSLQNGIYFNSVSHSTVQHLYVHDAIFHGIFNFIGSYNTFANNELASNRYRPIHAHSGASYNRYVNNYIHNNGTAGGSTYGGLFVIYAAASDPTSYNIISGNIIEDENSLGGIVVGGSATSVGNVIVGNTIKISNADTHGILLNKGDDSDGATGTVIANNHITAGRHGIVFESGGFAGTLVTDNDIHSVGGVGIYPAVAQINLTIQGNRIWAEAEEVIRCAGAVTLSRVQDNFLMAHNTYSGLRLHDSSGNIISGNTFYNCKWSVDETTDGGNSGNLIYDNIENTIAQSPTMTLQSTKIRGNSGYVTENSGTFTILTGATSTNITHGLSYTPAIGDLTMTANAAMGSATYLYADNFNASWFLIKSNADPVSVNITGGWSVRK